MQLVNSARILRQQWANLSQKLSRLWLPLVLLLASLLLSGCVKSDLAINFQGQSGGEIVQHIQLSDQLTTLNGPTTQQWFSAIKRQARQLQGRVKQSEQEISVVIPFDNGADLQAKLNQFLSAAFQTPGQSTAGSQLELLQSHLQVKQQNFLFLLRNRLTYDLDLRSLGVQSPKGNLLLNPESLLKLTFRLNTPWGAQTVNTPNSSNEGITPDVVQQGQQLAWHLQPGQLNHLEAVFWYPSPIGIGAVVIALLVAGGSYLKYGSRLVAETGSSVSTP